MQIDDLKNILSAAGLRRMSDDIINLQKESIRLVPNLGRQDEFSLKSSRLGGIPLLPSAMDWPTFHDLPMGFVAQILLADLAPFPLAGPLPKNGILSFFYDANQETYGDSVEDREAWKVIYTPAIESAIALPVPRNLPDSARYPAVPLQFLIEMTLPGSPVQYNPAFNWTEVETQRYEAFLKDYQGGSGSGTVHHRMFGYPDQIQDDMQLQCSLISKGIYDMNDPMAAGVIAKKDNWQLLLQIDTDESAKMKWSSAGRLYFWIEEQVMRSQDFDRSWLVLQAD